MGRAVSCILVSLLLIAVLLATSSLSGLWHKAARPLAWIAASLGWLALGHFTFVEYALAPDLFAAGIAGRIAGIASLICGLVIGYTGGDLFTRVINRLILLSSIVFVAGLCLALFDPPGRLAGDVYLPGERFGGLIRNANVTATAAGAILLLALGCFLAPDGRSDRKPRYPQTLGIGTLAHGAAVLLGLLVVFLTGSRFGIAVVALLTMGLGYLIWRADRTLSLARSVSIPVLVVFIAFAVILTSDLFIARLSELDSGSTIRAQMWLRYWNAAMDSPVFGYGPGSFTSLNGFFDLPDQRSLDGVLVANSPHNLFLQLLLSGGVPYLVMMILAAAPICLAIWRHFASHPRPSREWGVLFAILFVFSEGMIDIALDVPATIILGLFLTGLLWGKASIQDR